LLEEELNVLYKLSRFLQALGLVLPLVGIAGNIARPDEINLKVSLIISGIGIALFFLGWLVQQAARPRS
jgi:hypothetical protein